MSGLIVYKSKYGATERYAKWLGEDTGFEVKELSKVSKKILKNYDIIVFGSGIYMSKLSIASHIQKFYKAISDKKIIAFGVGSCPDNEENINIIKFRSFNEKTENIPFFYCRGIIDVNNMKKIDKFLCEMLQVAVAQKSPADRSLLEETIATSGHNLNDWTDKKYIRPIVDFIDNSIWKI